MRKRLYFVFVALLATFACGRQTTESKYTSPMYQTDGGGLIYQLVTEAGRQYWKVYSMDAEKVVNVLPVPSNETATEVVTVWTVSRDFIYFFRAAGGDSLPLYYVSTADKAEWGLFANVLNMCLKYPGATVTALALGTFAEVSNNTYLYVFGHGDGELQQCLQAYDATPPSSGTATFLTSVTSGAPVHTSVCVWTPLDLQPYLISPTVGVTPSFLSKWPVGPFNGRILRGGSDYPRQSGLGEECFMDNRISTTLDGAVLTSAGTVSDPLTLEPLGSLGTRIYAAAFPLPYFNHPFFVVNETGYVVQYDNNNFIPMRYNPISLYGCPDCGVFANGGELFAADNNGFRHLAEDAWVNATAG
mmetsp:Transcript_13988/g.39772  ORF Transcript_13988/g.39772 Transcript_13988/m.39772 type:complete len:359 (-) Transcript_13988:242-1318(-)